jgi:hypothetical protein
MQTFKLTCLIRSGVYSRGYANAYVILDPVNERLYNAHHIYPAMVGTCLLLQLIIYGLMYSVMSPGAKVFRPDEDDKMDHYRHVHGLGSPEIEMRRRSTATSPLYPGSRHPSDAADMLLPPPAVSPHSSPQLNPMTQRNPTSTVTWGDYPIETRDRSGSSFSLGSPDTRTSEHPLLSSNTAYR